MIRLIVAMDQKQGLAKQGFMPWNIPQDVAYFKEQTKLYGGDVLVGSTTFKTFEHPLTDRQTFVLTHDKTPIEGATPVHDLHKFLNEFKDRDLWVVGGANVFAQVLELNMADELLVTAIEADFGCNQFFPPIPDNFEHVEQSELHEQNGFIFTYNRFVKKV